MSNQRDSFTLQTLQLDDSLLQQQQRAYAVQGVDETEPAQASQKNKRKKDDSRIIEEVRSLSDTFFLRDELFIPCLTS